MSADVLRRLYTDWYRPDLMAVVAVGDIDTAEIEEGIRDRFDQIPAAAPTARLRPTVTAPTRTTLHVDRFTDTESTPGNFFKPRSTRPEQAAQVIP